VNFYFFDNRENKVREEILLNRGNLYGDGFFTTGIVKDGKILHQNRHFERLQNTATKFQFADYNEDLLIQFLLDSLKDIDEACIRITISRQQAGRGYQYNQLSKSDVTVQLSHRPEAPVEPCHLVLSETPVSVNAFLAGSKHLNRLDSVLASRQIKSDNQEVVLFHEDNVIGGSRSNLFVLDNKQWKTPSLEMAGVEGITRQRIIELMQQNGIPVSIEPITLQKIQDVEAAFITNSLLGIWPVSKIADKCLETIHVENLKSDINFVV